MKRTVALLLSSLALVVAALVPAHSSLAATKPQKTIVLRGISYAESSSAKCAYGSSFTIFDSTSPYVCIIAEFSRWLGNHSVVMSDYGPATNGALTPAGTWRKSWRGHGGKVYVRGAVQVIGGAEHDPGTWTVKLWVDTKLTATSNFEIATNTPPTATPVPPTDTPVPTATPIPQTATPAPPTATPIPPTATAVPPTATPSPTPVPRISSLNDTTGTTQWYGLADNETQVAVWVDSKVEVGVYGPTDGYLVASVQEENEGPYSYDSWTGNFRLRRSDGNVYECEPDAAGSLYLHSVTLQQGDRNSGAIMCGPLPGGTYTYALQWDEDQVIPFVDLLEIPVSG